MLPYNKNLKVLSRELRKNMTEAEKLVWSRVRAKQVKGVQFYRQKIIGNYIADFYCPKGGLVVEIDGGQHCHGEQARKDLARDAYLSGMGLKVVRFPANVVFRNMDGVLEEIGKWI
jgi:very-short-patch-repair endonuclease